MQQQKLDLHTIKEANTLLVQQVKTHEIKEAEWKKVVTPAQEINSNSRAELEKALVSIEGLTQALQEKEQGMLTIMQEHKMQITRLEQQLELDQ